MAFGVICFMNQTNTSPLGYVKHQEQMQIGLRGSTNTSEIGREPFSF